MWAIMLCLKVIINITMKETLSFYDVKSKSKFDSNEYHIENKNNRYFAVTKSPNGPHNCWRVLSKEQGERLK